MTTRGEQIRLRAVRAVEQEDIQRYIGQLVFPEFPSADEISSDVVTTLEGALEDKAETGLQRGLKALVKQCVREVLDEELAK